MPKNHIFVYGLLKSMYDNEPAKFIRKNCTLVGNASFPGVLLDLGTYPGAVYDADSTSTVYGEVFQVNRNEKELVQFLDNFEGVGAQFQQPNEYKREVIPVVMSSQKVNASCYLYNWNLEGLKVIKSGRYENVKGNR